MTSPKLTDDDQIAVWQAEGVLMELSGCGVVEAALLLRWRALVQNMSLIDAARGVLFGTW